MGVTEEGTEDSEDNGPDDHENSLYEVCPDDSSETTSNREETGNGQEEQDGEVDRTVTLKPCGLGDEESTSIQVSLHTTPYYDNNAASLLTEILVNT